MEDMRDLTDLEINNYAMFLPYRPASENDGTRSAAVHRAGGR